jgi:hypothetical protein
VGLRKWWQRIQDKAADPHIGLAEGLRQLCWRRWCIAGACYSVWGVAAGVQPWLVAAIVRNIEDDEGTTLEGIGLAFLLFGSTLAYSLAINHKFHQLSRMGIQVRSVLCTLLFEKAVRLHVSVGPSVGAATNLMSTFLRCALWLTVALGGTLDFAVVCCCCSPQCRSYGLLHPRCNVLQPPLRTTTQYNPTLRTIQPDTTQPDTTQPCARYNLARSNLA